MEANLVIKHFRPDMYGNIHRYYKGNSDYEPQSKGGQTFISLEFDNGDVAKQFVYTVAVCRPDETFCYSHGRGVAAIRMLPLAKKLKLKRKLIQRLDYWASQVPDEWSIS